MDGKGGLDGIEKLGQIGANDILLVTGEVDKNLFLSARNIPHVAICDVEALNPVALLRHKKVLMTADAVKKLDPSGKTSEQLLREALRIIK